MPETSDEKNNTEKSEPVSRFVEPRDGVQRLYSNHLNALWTPYDVSIKFSLLTNIAEATDKSPRTHTYEELALVTVAWTEAKMLAAMLSDIVRRYEELNGEIKIGDIP
jgi:hypothetical protein